MTCEKHWLETNFSKSFSQGKNENNQTCLNVYSEILNTMMDIFIPLLMKINALCQSNFQKAFVFHQQRKHAFRMLQSHQPFSERFDHRMNLCTKPPHDDQFSHSKVGNGEEINIFHKNIKENKMEFKKNSNLLTEMFLTKMNDE